MYLYTLKQRGALPVGVTNNFKKNVSLHVETTREIEPLLCRGYE